MSWNYVTDTYLIVLKISVKTSVITKIFFATPKVKHHTSILKTSYYFLCVQNLANKYLLQRVIIFYNINIR